jgi:hypothetical protein
MLRKLPIGIQDFEGLRTNGYIYVDKTALLYRLAVEGNPYFLARPRRFGKSLLLSTLKAYFLGKRELFTGLAIAELEKDWTEHPVFHIDMSIGASTTLEDLNAALDASLRILEETWGKDPEDTLPAVRFLNLLRRAAQKTGKNVVVLVDEYDKPLLGSMDNPELPHETEKIRSALKAFYGVLKTADAYLRFVLLTGVTKFSQVSIFSDLNQLRDISMDWAYAEICGISERELCANFEPEISALGEENALSREETLTQMRKKYNGYHFCENSEGMYNPFSVLCTFASKKFGYYWFQTGTPAFLVKRLAAADFDLCSFGRAITISGRSISDYRENGGSPVPILYQSGYLTIKGYDSKFDEYALGFPNEEVKYGFLEALLPLYMSRPGTHEFFAGYFVRDLQKADVDGFMERLRAFFADIPYELNDKTERHYQTVFYLVFTLMGQFCEAEAHSARGRADAVVSLQDTVYVFEFKLSGNATAEEALRQIDEKDYLAPYAASGKKLIKVGVVFDAASRAPGDWKAEFL